MQQEANKHGIPVAFCNDEVKCGKLIGGYKENCLVIYHPVQKEDYYKTAIRIKHQGNYAFIKVHDFGKSKLLGHKTNVKEFAKTWSVVDLAVAGVSKFKTLGKDQRDVEEEQNWYAMVSDVLSAIL